MDEGTLASYLHDVAAGRISVEEAIRRLKDLPFLALGDANADLHRELRTGQAEAVYGPGKTDEQVGRLVRALVEEPGGAVYVTRATPGQYEAARVAAPMATYHPRSGLIVARRTEEAPLGHVLVVTAGTSDGPVAEEAAVASSALGLKVEEVSDVGVAGVHRVAAHRDALDGADCAIVVAGMEGALPSLVAGLTSTPVVAVPTSVGYGASFRGLAALLAMLNACAAGVAVVNIDNGFGAALFAHRVVAARAGDR